VHSYLKRHHTSPVSGERLSSHTLLPNRLLLNMLRLHFPEALRRRVLPFFLQVCVATKTNQAHLACFSKVKYESGHWAASERRAS
jgi:hypothetical protein